MHIQQHIKTLKYAFIYLQLLLL